MSKPVTSTTAQPFTPPSISKTSRGQSSVVKTVSQLSSRMCSECDKEGRLVCSNCKELPYCGADCQKKGWKVHKTVCRAPNSFGGMASDLNRLSLPLPSDDEVVCEFRDKDGKISPLTQKEFRSKTGRTFTPFFRASEEVISNWEKLPPVQTSPFFDFLASALFPNKEAIKAFEKEPPKLYLIDEPLFGGFGVAAGRKIKKGEIICFYTGDFMLSNQSRSFKSTLYGAAGVDPFVITGFGGFINDGLPNAILSDTLNYKGIPKAPLVMAIQDILEGETIWLDYSIEQSIVEAAYEVTDDNYRKLKEYCLSGALYEDYNNLSNASLHKRYILGRLTLFFRLLLDGSLDVEKTKKMLFRVTTLTTNDFEVRSKNQRDFLVKQAEYFLSINNKPLIEETALPC